MELFSVLITCTIVLLGVFKRKSRTLSFILFLLLWILFAFEKTDKGDGDYERYVRHYDNIAAGLPVVLEPLFILFSYIGNHFNLTFDTARAILVFFELLLIYRTISYFTTSIALVLSLFFIFPAFFDAELFRWFLAMSIIIFGLPILIESSSFKGYAKFFLIILLASTAHSSALFFSFFLLMALKNNKSIYVFAISLSIIGVLSAQTGLLYKIIGYLPVSTDLVADRYSYYSIGTIRSAFYFSFLLLLSFVVGYLSVVGKPIRRLPTSMGGFSHGCANKNLLVYLNGNRLLNKVMRLNAISLCLLPIALYSAQGQRLLQVFLFINYLSIAISCERFKTGSGPRLVISVISTILILIWMVFFCSEGATAVFFSHFKTGYLINFCNTCFGIQ